MDETTSQPLVYANRVINQLVKHMVGEDTILEFKDYHSLRSVFRRCGGSWEELASGSPTHMELLKTIVTAWGQMPNRPKESDRLI